MDRSRLDKAYDSIKDRLNLKPDIAVVLGSGLGAFADSIEDSTVIPYGDIACFPVSTVCGHAGRYVTGSIGGRHIIAMQGRVHYYEGYTMEQVVLPIRLMRLLGAKTILLTNAAGGINSSFEAGDLMIIRDHITSFVPSPLIGKNDDSLGTRFPDMSNVYNDNLAGLLEASAKELGIAVRQGIYLQTTGPNYETPAEIRMFAAMGADAVGMSTACEAMAAAHMGMRVAGISCITNMAAGMSDRPLSHDEVKSTADRISEDFAALVNKFITSL